VDLKEQLISSRPVYDGKIINVHVDRLRVADGREFDREVVSHSGAVAIVAMPDPDTVFLVRQYRHPVEQVLLEIPAGGINQGEVPDECANRELMEEINYRADSLKYLFSAYVAPGYSSELIHLYLATDLHKEARDKDEDENLLVERVPLKDAIRMITEGKIIDAKSICGLLYVQADARR
jgi:ADP-ribose pyrophosphatase